MIITEEDIKFIDFAYSCINKAHYPASKQTVDVYNRVFSGRPNFKPRAITSCGSCIRQMVLELKEAKDRIIEKFEKENNLNKDREENKDGEKHEATGCDRTGGSGSLERKDEA